MAWSRSLRTVDEPCIATPPVMVTLAVFPLLFFDDDGPGVEVREVGLDLFLDLGCPRSDTRDPNAEGGGFEVWVGGGVAVLVGGGLLGPLVACEGVEAPDRAEMYSSCESFLL